MAERPPAWDSFNNKLDELKGIAVQREALATEQLERLFASAEVRIQSLASLAATNSALVERAATTSEFLLALKETDLDTEAINAIWDRVIELTETRGDKQLTHLEDLNLI